MLPRRYYRRLDLSLFSHRYYSLPPRIVLFGCIIRLFPLPFSRFLDLEKLHYTMSTLSLLLTLVHPELLEYASRREIEQK